MTITPTATWSTFIWNLYLGGALRESLIAQWAAGNSAKPEEAAVTGDWNRILRHLPLSEVDDQILSASARRKQATASEHRKTR